jgi:hypothetical protein
MYSSKKKTSSELETHHVPRKFDHERLQKHLQNVVNSNAANGSGNSIQIAQLVIFPLYAMRLEL